ncbi:Hypothetical predicted protein, partial [Pelobates cultripes]
TAHKAKLYRLLTTSSGTPQCPCNADNFTEVKNMIALIASTNTVSLRLEKLENPQASIPNPATELPTPSLLH